MRRAPVLALVILGLLLSSPASPANATPPPAGFVAAWNNATSTSYPPVGSCAFSGCLSWTAGTAAAVSRDGTRLWTAGSGRVASLALAANGLLADASGVPTCDQCFALPRNAGPFTGLLLSPDERQVYVLGRAVPSGWLITVLDRDPASGAIAQRTGSDGCLSSESMPDCTSVRGLGGNPTWSMTPDGRSLYVIDAADGAIAIIERSSDGTLSQEPGQAGCVGSVATRTDWACEDGGPAYQIPVDVLTLGSHAYVTSHDVFGSSTFQQFDRSPVTGALTPLSSPGSCITGSADPICSTVPMATDAHLVSAAAGTAFVAVSATTSDVALLLPDPVTGALHEPAGPAGCMGVNGQPCGDSTPPPRRSGAPTTPALVRGDATVAIPWSGPDSNSYDLIDITAEGFRYAETVTCATCWAQHDPSLVPNPVASAAYRVTYQLTVLTGDVAPVCQSEITVLHVGTATPMLCYDTDGTRLTFSAAPTSHGTLSPRGTYASPPEFVGDDTMPFDVSDGVNVTHAVTTIHVVDSAPLCDAYIHPAIFLGSTTAVTERAVWCVDGERDPLTIVATASGSARATVNADGTVTVAPIGVGAGSVAMTAFDGALSSTPVIIPVTVGSVPTVTAKVDGAVAVTTVDNRPAYFADVGNPITITWALHGLGGYNDDTHAFVQSLAGGKPVQFDQRLDLAWGTATSNLSVRIVGKAASGCADWCVSQGALVSDPIAVFVGTRIDIARSARRGANVAITFAFSAPRSATRGSAFLERLVSGHWRRVRRLRVAANRASAVIPLDGRTYRVLYSPRSALDLVPTYVSFVSRWRAPSGHTPATGGIRQTSTGRNLSGPRSGP